MPHIPGIDLPGVYVFRDMDNVQQLAARRVRTRRTVVLGGGLLGIEAARAMQRFHTDVFVVEHDDRLLPRQLDAAASALLQQNVEARGIQVVLDDGALRIYGNSRVEGIQLRSGREIPCDTVIVATGIRPHVDLARQAGLSVGRGIRVNNSMRTSDRRIFAVGECAEHRGLVYGLVAPGLEQAAVAAHVMTGADVQYAGSTSATRLKVLNYPVFSMGEVGADELPDGTRRYLYKDPANNAYRKLVLYQGRLIGALAMGEWADIPRIQEAISRNRRVWPWQIWYFRRHGSLWPEAEAQQVQDWPASAVVCNCTGVTRGRLSEAMAAGCLSVGELAACTGASSVCGSCKPLLTDLLGASTQVEAVPAARILSGFALAAVGLALVWLLLPGIPFADSVIRPVQWDQLWRGNLAKQISGYGLLGMVAGLAVLGLRKRIKRFTPGDYSVWRLIHVVLGVAVLLGFAVHTGGHLGTHLNFWLASGFIGAALAGGVFAAVLAREHQLDPWYARRLKTLALWSHILLLWPLPVLLGFHIAQGYVF